MSIQLGGTIYSNSIHLYLHSHRKYMDGNYGLVTKWNKHWPGLGSPGLDQGNGSSSMNGPKLHVEYMLS